MKIEPLDEIYIRKVLEGDEASFGYFITKYKDMAFTVAISIVKDENIAQEVVQDAFLKAFKGLRSFKKQSGFSTWFYRIVMNEAFMRLKKMKQEILSFNADYNEDFQDETAFFSLNEAEQSHFINEALKRLPPKESLLLRLYYLQEESVKTVCEITGMSESNVKVILHRARKNMFRVIHAMKTKEL